MGSQIFPREYQAAGWNAGLKESDFDFGVIHSKRAAVAGAIFTRNNFPGNPVIVGREHSARGRLQTIVVNSKISNVATGEAGLELARNTCRWASENLGTSPDLVLPSSTGVIGRLIPSEIIQKACGEIKERLNSGSFEDFSRAIMTTDRGPKIKSMELKSGIRLLGVCKGAGMIQPNMATMLSYSVSDAEISTDDLRRLLKCVADRTFNRVSIDSDTSTSDTFCALANGASGVKISFSENAARAYESLNDPFEAGALERIADLDDASREYVRGFQEISKHLTKMIAADGEGATRLIELKVTEARDRDQALKIARSVINSPLVKTAVYGADPNWGRFIMAVGKVFDEPVPAEKLRIFFGEKMLTAAPEDLKLLSDYLKNPEVFIRISLGMGSAQETVWGCDLNEEYVRINSYYTT